VQHGLDIRPSHFCSRAQEGYALDILQFKLDVLWTMLDALWLAYVTQRPPYHCVDAPQ
jgi:pyrroloquinoline-quinone synthase